MIFNIPQIPANETFRKSCVFRQFHSTSFTIGQHQSISLQVIHTYRSASFNISPHHVIFFEISFDIICPHELYFIQYSSISCHIHWAFHEPISFRFVHYQSTSFRIIACYSQISFRIIQYQSVSFDIFKYHLISFVHKISFNSMSLSAFSCAISPEILICII